MKLFSFRNLRVVILLTMLAYAAIYTKSQRVETMAWIEPLEVAIFPINADQDAATSTYISQLQASQFKKIDAFFSKQGARYNVLSHPPTNTLLGPEVTSLPPPPPGNNASAFSIGLWTLQIRYWAWRNAPDGYSGKNTVHIFVLYQQPRKGQRLRHSLGLQKGLLGIVYAFATPKKNGQNNIVIAHELLHTVGASDKYDTSGMPIYPTGYASPDRSPLYPQTRCEIMAGRIAVSTNRATMAGKLRKCIIGATTAAEIQWIDDALQ